MTLPYDGAELVAVLPCADLDRAEAWYGRLGFTALASYDDYRIVGSGELRLHLTRLPDTDGPRESRSGVYLYVSDADAIHAAWSVAGARIIHEPIDQPYGLREFATEDIDGNLWRVGSPISSDEDPQAEGAVAAPTVAVACTAPTDGSTGTGDDSWLEIVSVATCAGCSLSAGDIERAVLGDRLRDEAHRWSATLSTAGDDAVRSRPTPTTWSALEYGVHVRDVLAVFTERLVRMLVEDAPELGWWDHEAAIEDGFANESDVGAVADDLAENAARLAEALSRVDEAGWTRTGTRRGAETFTVDLLARFVLHEVVHHRADADQCLTPPA